MPYEAETVYEFQRDFTEYGGCEGMFWRTYGGGPEGGYVVCPDLTCYEVHRGWGQGWCYSSIKIDYLYLLIDEQGIERIWNDLSGSCYEEEFAKIEEDENITVFDFPYLLELMEEQGNGFIL